MNDSFMLELSPIDFCCVYRIPVDESNTIILTLR